MKKTLLLAAFALLFTVLRAQPVLDQTAVGSIGATFYLGVQDTFTPGYSLGSAGANQTWNMASLLVNSTDTVRFVDPAGTANAADFPSANLAIDQASLGGTAYLLSSPSGLDLQGLVGDLLGTGTPLVIHQTPASRIAQFPFTYQNSFSNTSTIDVTVDASSFGIAFVDSARIKRISMRDLTADGYGTLILPAGTNSNVLRVKEVNDQNDSLWIHSFLGWSLFQDTVYTDSTFTWWNNSKGYYLAQATYSGGELVTLNYQDPVIVGRAEPTSAAFAVYPNPVQDRLYIDTDGKSYSLQISDLQGRVVYLQRLMGPQAELSVGQLPRGYYLYTLLDKNGLPKQSGKLLLTN